MKVRSSLIYRVYEMTDFKILRVGGRTAMDFRTADFNFFKALLGRIPCKICLERRAVQKSWLIFKDQFLQTQKQCMATSGKSSRR